MQRHDFTVVGSYVSSDSNVRSLANPASGIQSAADLRGRRVGVVVGTDQEFCLDVLLTDHGLSAADVNRVPMKRGKKWPDALLKRRVDAIATFEPYLSHAQKALGNTGHVLLDRDRCVSTGSYVTHRGFSRQRLEALIRLLRGTGQAIDWMRSHRQEAIALVARSLAITSADLEAQWDNYRFVLELRQASFVGLEQQALWAMRSGLAPGAAMPNYLHFFDFTALEAVKPRAIDVIR